MNHAVRIALLVFTAVGTATAGSFTANTLPPAAVEQLTAVAAGNSYLKATGVHTFAAAHTFGKDGYIGTVHLPDVSTIDNGPTEVAVPEPTTLVLFGSGLAVAAWRRRRIVLHGRLASANHLVSTN